MTEVTTLQDISRAYKVYVPFTGNMYSAKSAYVWWLCRQKDRELTPYSEGYTCELTEDEFKTLVAKEGYDWELQNTPEMELSSGDGEELRAFPIDCPNDALSWLLASGKEFTHFQQKEDVRYIDYLVVALSAEEIAALDAKGIRTYCVYEHVTDFRYYYGSCCDDVEVEQKGCDAAILDYLNQNPRYIASHTKYSADAAMGYTGILKPATNSKQIYCID